MFFLTATGASAQSLLSEVTSKVSVAGVENPVIAKAKVNKGMHKINSNEIAFGYPGCTEPVAMNIYADAKATGVCAQINGTEIGSKYAGYKLTGMGFAVLASLGQNAAAFAVVWKQDVDQGEAIYKELSEDSYEISTITTEDNKNYLDDKWNDIYFDEPYEITSDVDALRYGLLYDAVAADATDPILLGQTDDINNGYSFMLYGNLGSQGETWYLGATEKYPFTPCMYLILQAPNGENAIIGVDKAGHVTTPQQYFSANGAQLSAPQKGLNIVKMSDGTTMKVVVK